MAFHRVKSRDDLAESEQKIEAFLTHLAVDQRVAAATQNQAMNALVFLYKRVLEQPLNETINAVRAEKKMNVPVVLTRQEVMQVIPLLEGVPQLIAKLLYGSGLRIMEAVRLRATSSCGSQRDQQGDQGRNAPGWISQTDQCPHLPAQFCDAFAAARHRHSHDSSAARTPQCGVRVPGPSSGLT